MYFANDVELEHQETIDTADVLLLEQPRTLLPSVETFSIEEVTQQLHDAFLHTNLEQPDTRESVQPLDSACDSLLLTEASDGRTVLIALAPSIHAAGIRQALLLASHVQLPINPALLNHPTIQIRAATSATGSQEETSTWFTDLLNDGQAIQETAEGLTFWQRNRDNPTEVTEHELPNIVIPGDNNSSDPDTQSEASAEDPSENVSSASKGREGSSEILKTSTSEYEMFLKRREDGEVELWIVFVFDGKPQLYHFAGGEQERKKVIAALLEKGEHVDQIDEQGKPYRKTEMTRVGSAAGLDQPDGAIIVKLVATMGTKEEIPPPVEEVETAQEGSDSGDDDIPNGDPSDVETSSTPEQEQTIASYRLQAYQRDDGKMDLRRRDGTPFEWRGGEEERTAVMRTLGTDRKCIIEKPEGGRFEWSIDSDGRIRFTEASLKTEINLDPETSIPEDGEMLGSDSDEDSIGDVRHKTISEGSEAEPEPKLSNVEQSSSISISDEQSESDANQADAGPTQSGATVADGPSVDAAGNDDNSSSSKTAQPESTESSSDEASDDDSEPTQSDSGDSADESDETTTTANDTIAEIEAQAITEATIHFPTIVVTSELTNDKLVKTNTLGSKAASGSLLVGERFDVGERPELNARKIPLNPPLQRGRHLVPPLSKRGVSGDFGAEPLDTTERTKEAPFEIAEPIRDSRPTVELDAEISPDDPVNLPPLQPDRPPAPDDYLAAKTPQSLERDSIEKTIVHDVETVLEQKTYSADHTAESTRSNVQTTNAQSTRMQAGTRQIAESNSQTQTQDLGAKEKSRADTVTEIEKTEIQQTEQKQQLSQKSATESATTVKSQERSQEHVTVRQERAKQTVATVKTRQTATQTQQHDQPKATEQNKSSNTKNETKTSSAVSSISQHMVRAAPAVVRATSQRTTQQVEHLAAIHPAREKQSRSAVEVVKRESTFIDNRSLLAEQRLRRKNQSSHAHALEAEIPFATRNTAQEVVQEALDEVRRRAEYEGSALGLQLIAHAPGRIQPDHILPLKHTIHELSAVPADIHVHDERVVIKLRQSDITTAQHFTQIASKRGYLRNNTLTLPLAA